MREVPRAAEPVREVVTSPDEETLEDHDITEVQEPPQMTFSHKRKPAWARELIQDEEKYGVPEGTKTGEETKAILQLHGFDVQST
jgi:U3 small nucleolar RNA-associated protein 14